jgi:hypothetical protein
MAGGFCPTLMQKSVTMHVLRHSAAMRLLHAGIDTSVIALWLGHENGNRPRATWQRGELRRMFFAKRDAAPRVRHKLSIFAAKRGGSQPGWGDQGCLVGGGIGARRRHASNSNTANCVSIPGKRGPGFI